MVVKVSLLSGAVTSDGALSIQTNAGTEAIGITTGQVISLAQNPILSAGTINGVAYLNGSKILTTGSALVFDSTNTRLGVGNASPNFNLDVLSSSGASAFVGTSASSTGTLFGALKFGSTAGANAYIEQGAQIRGYAKTGVNTGYLSFYTSNGSLAEQMRLDEIGNLGLGVTPSAWGSTALQVKGASLVSYNGLQAAVMSNAYTTDALSTYKYINTGYATQYYQGGGAHYWYNAASGYAGNTISFGDPKMTLDASGRLLVGNTTQVSNNSNANFWGPNRVADSWGQIAVVTTDAYGADVGGQIALGGAAGSSVYGNFGSIAGRKENATNNNYAGYLAFTTTTSAGTGTERARIDSSGNLLVGTPTPDPTNNAFSYQPASKFAQFSHASGTSSGTGYIYFTYSGSITGSVTQNGTTGVLYNITSDYRLKNNQENLTGAKEFIMALKPKKWQWWDGSGEGVGFIAHEFMEVAKYSGHGEKDAVETIEIKDEDGNVTGTEERPIYQSIQPSSTEVMANLVAHIQELEARLAALEAK